VYRKLDMLLYLILAGAIVVLSFAFWKMRDAGRGETIATRRKKGRFRE
jgi:hypothetical protein